MEIRKLGKIGGTSLFVTLPSQWLARNGLSKGDEVCIEESDNILMLCKKEPDVEKDLPIDEVVVS